MTSPYSLSAFLMNFIIPKSFQLIESMGVAVKNDLLLFTEWCFKTGASLAEAEKHPKKSIEIKTKLRIS